MCWPSAAPGRRGGNWSGATGWCGSAGPGLAIDPQAPLPLILYAPPSVTRSVALEALERAGRAWRVVCTSGSLSGLRAAALAGLGITLHARSLIPEGLVEAPAALRLPDAGEVEFVVTTRPRRRARPGGGAGGGHPGERRPVAGGALTDGQTIASKRQLPLCHWFPLTPSLRR